MIKVTLLHNMYVYPKNGVNTVIKQLLAKKHIFEKRGLYLESLTLEDLNGRKESTVVEGIPKKSFRGKVKTFLNRSAQKRSIVAFFVIYLTNFLPAKKMAKLYLSKEHEDNEVVFMHSLAMCYYYLKFRKKKQPSVVVLHSNGDNLKMWRIYYPSIENTFVLRWLERVERVVIEGADRINFVSEMSKNIFLSLHPEINKEKVFFIHNGIEDGIIDKNRNKEERPMEFCCVASISNRKGQMRIIEALNKFERSKMPNVHFTFVGDGSERENMQRYVEDSELKNYVNFAGLSKNVDKFLLNSDAYILASEDEGLPMGIIEAMKYSLPIVTTGVGGILEMVQDGYNGVIIEPTVDSVYNFLANIDKFNWGKLGEKSREVFELRFTANQMAEKYSEILSFTK